MATTNRTPPPDTFGDGWRKGVPIRLKGGDGAADESPRRPNCHPTDGEPDMGLPVTAPPTVGGPPAGGGGAPGGASPGRDLPDGIRKSLQAFVRLLPELLARHRNRWVACDASGFRAVGDDWDAVYGGCLAGGLRADEFVVDYVMPGMFDDLDYDALRDPA